MFVTLGGKPGYELLIHAGTRFATQFILIERLTLVQSAVKVAINGADYDEWARRQRNSKRTSEELSPRQKAENIRSLVSDYHVMFFVSLHIGDAML